MKQWIMHSFLHCISTTVQLIPFLLTSIIGTALAENTREASQAALGKFKNEIAPVLKKNCVSCHGPDKQKNDFRIDTLDPDLIQGNDAPVWDEVLHQLNRGDMPPEEEDQPTPEELHLVTEWLETELARAAEMKTGEDSRAPMRRLTKYEYNNTLRELFGLPVDFDSQIPKDRVDAEGLINNSEVLGISPMQLQVYLDSARTAVRKALGEREKPKEVFKRVETGIAPFVEPIWGLDRFNNQPGRVFPQKDGVIVRLGSSYLFLLPEKLKKGPIKIRCRVGGLPSSRGINPRLQVWIGYTAPGINYSRKLVGEVEVKTPPSDPEIVEFSGLLENFPQPRDDKSAANSNQRLIWFINADDTGAGEREDFVVLDYKYHVALLREMGLAATGNKKLIKANQKELELLNKQYREAMEPDAKLFLDWIEFKGNHYLTWPPKSRTNILFASPERNEDDSYIEEVINRFASRAWRRPAEPEEINRYTKAFQGFRNTSSFEDAIVDTLALVLTSPNFLFHVEPNTGDTPRKLSNYELASRLSYFLWASPPDDPLRKLAESGKIEDPSILRKEVDRMLEDKRSERFVHQFCQHWLGLDSMDLVAINPEFFPRFDDKIKFDLRKQTYALFDHVLHKDLSCLDFLDSDYVMLNGRLASYYGIEGVVGPHFRPVQVDSSRRRGGLITQGGFLMAASDGIEPNPIYRGKWVLAQLLGDPPSPPPPNVPELDSGNPDFASLSLKEQLALHRDKVACARCHDKLDPWGLALEHYDATGRWRETETVRKPPVPDLKGQAEQLMGKRKIEKVTPGKPIDAKTDLPDGTPVNDVKSLKKYIRSHKHEVFAKGLVEKMLSYALGRSLSWRDSGLVKDLTINFEKNDYIMRSLIKDIVSSKAFLQKH